MNMHKLVHYFPLIASSGALDYNFKISFGGGGGGGGGEVVCAIQTRPQVYWTFLFL